MNQAELWRFAAAGLLLGCRAREAVQPEAPVVRIEPTPHQAPDASDDDPFVHSPAVTRARPTVVEPRDCCKGMNDCKGKGNCKVQHGHDCAGKNECKGRGGCKPADCPPR